MFNFRFLHLLTPLQRRRPGLELIDPAAPRRAPALRRPAALPRGRQHVGRGPGTGGLQQQPGGRRRLPEKGVPEKGRRRRLPEKLVGLVGFRAERGRGDGGGCSGSRERVRVEQQRRERRAKDAGGQRDGGLTDFSNVHGELEPGLRHVQKNPGLCNFTVVKVQVPLVKFLLKRKLVPIKWNFSTTLPKTQSIVANSSFGKYC